MFKRIVYPSLVAGVGVIGNYVYCEDRWKIADEYKASNFRNYSIFPATFDYKYTHKESDIVHKFNEDSKYLCKVSCGRYPFHCKLSEMYELENKNGVFVPKGLDRKTTDRIIVRQDIKKFKMMDQTRDLRKFVISNWPEQIFNVKNPTFSDFRQAVRTNVELYPLIEKLISKKDLKDIRKKIEFFKGIEIIEYP